MAAIREDLALAPPRIAAVPRSARSRALAFVRWAISIVVAMPAVALLALVVVTPLDLRTQTALAGLSLALALVLRRARAATLALILLSATASLRYVYWRTTTTVTLEWTLDSTLGALLLCAEIYSVVMLLLSYVQSVGPLPRRPVPLPDDLSRWPTVDVYVPTYDEPLEVVRATVLAAAAIDWPSDRFHVYVLDDGRRESFAAFAAEAGVGYLTRPRNEHAKAGNLNAALARTHGQFIAIFDCDHVPARSFLQVAMGEFLRDDRLALVQTPHHFYSPDPISRNLRTFGRVPNEGELFYGLIQPGDDTWNAAFFCGSCAVLRRSALDDVGGIPVDTVTEDAHTALKMHRRGWRTAYLDVPQAAGLATETLSAHIGQRIRWSRGMAQIFRRENPLLGSGLGLAQRLCYLGAMLHFFSGIPRLVFLTAPIAYLLFGRHIFNALPLAALAYGFPHLAHSTLTASRIQGRFRYSFWSEIYETTLAPYISVPTTLALLDPRAGRFNVTAKGGRIEAPFFDGPIARPYVALACLNLAAFTMGAWKLSTGRGELDSLAINLGWSLHNLLILAATIAVACERAQLRATPRVAACLPAMLRVPGGHTVRCRTVDLARGGARIAVAAVTRITPGQSVWLSLFSTGADERPLPAEVLACDGDEVRLRFCGLTLEEEAALVEAIFSRADAWIGWTDARGRDRPLHALRDIARHGIVGIAAAVMLSARRTIARPQVAAARGRA